MLKKIAIVVGFGIIVVALGFVGFVWWVLQPRPEPRALPRETISLAEPEGKCCYNFAA